MITNEKLSLQAVVVQEAGNLISDMNGETVMLNIQHGKYYSLGAIGGRIWGLMEKPVSVAHIVDALLAEYEVDRPICEEQVLVFLEHLLTEGLAGVKS